MNCFHTTPYPESILQHGFRDAEGTYMTRELHRGVWVADRPLTSFEGAKGKAVLLVEIPESVLRPYEWIEDEKTYREFLVPAEIVNRYGPPELVDEDDYDW